MITATNPLEHVLSLLPDARVTGPNRWQARCPAHEDRHASLSIGTGADGKVLLKCHATCTHDEVVAAMGLHARDLFPRNGYANGNGHANGKPHRRIVKTYQYTNREGELLHETVRYEPKGFSQRRPDGRGRYVWSLAGIRTVLYRLPELMEADAAAWVFVAEGEKDCDRLYAEGFVATTNPMGAGKWKPEYSEALRGRRVVVIADRDGAEKKHAGQEHARAVVASLSGIAAEVKYLELPGDGVKDASDWFDAGGTAEQLARLVAQAGSTAADKPPRRAVLTRLSDVAPEQVEWECPNVIARRKLNLICGDPGVGKSTLTLYMAATVSTGSPWMVAPTSRARQGSIILIGAEDGLADTIRPRLDKAGADVSRIVALQGARRVSEDGKETIRGFSLDDLPTLADALEQTPDASMVIIDPVSAYLSSADSHKNAEIRGLLAPLAKLAEDYNVAVVMVTHLSKGDGARAMYRAMGSLAFIAAARTAWLVAEDKDDPARRLLLPIKNNLSESRSGFAFRVIDGALRWEPEPIDNRADDALTDQDEAAEEDREQAVDFLRHLLSGGPVHAPEVFKAARRDGINERSLRRAARELNIKPRREGFGPGSKVFWTIPDGHTLQDPVPSSGEKYAKYGADLGQTTTYEKAGSHTFQGEGTGKYAAEADPLDGVSFPGEA